MAVVNVSFPDTLTPAMDAFMKTQIAQDGVHYKYADYQDLVQQNFNDGLGQYFTQKTLDALVAPLQAQIDALKTQLSLTPPKTPVVVPPPAK